ncbi:hypothetical protein [Mucilaginibacter agri]|nr:hypothetical protein [Mucilaginibacter agri]
MKIGVVLYSPFFALGIAANTGHEPNACRRMSGKPGPQAMP